MHVALLANLKKNAPTWADMPPDRWDDLDSEETIEAIARALEAGGHRVTFLEGDATLFDKLREVNPDICFNICEGHFGDGREAQPEPDVDDPVVLRRLLEVLADISATTPLIFPIHPRTESRIAQARERESAYRLHQPRGRTPPSRKMC